MELSKELKDKAKKELGEKEEWIQRDIQALRERVTQNKGLESTCIEIEVFVLKTGDRSFLKELHETQDNIL